MGKLPKNLEEIRDEAIIYLYTQFYSAVDISKIFDLTTSAVYNIIKEYKQLTKKGK